MTRVCFYFQVHQPYRLKPYSIFDIGNDTAYFNDSGDNDRNNERVMRKVADKCYLPMNDVLYDLVERVPGFTVSFSITGTALEQFERYTPDVLDSFRKLIGTGRVELLAETYHHSLAFLFSPDEWRRQIALHQRRMNEVFGVTPRVLRNTELIYSNDIAELASDLGFRGVLAEGADHVLGWRSPNHLYTASPRSDVALLLKNYRLSDDIAFRFGEQEWAEYPLTAEKFARWVNEHNGSGDIVNLFMDYETFGEHQWEDTGIFDFMRKLPEEVLAHPDNRFVTPSQAVGELEPVGELDVPHYMSWADVERDLSAWRSNDLQEEALQAIYELEEDVVASGDEELIRDWRYLQTSDHFYYMCTKWFADGDVHTYFSPFESPYDAFIAYMNTLQDMRMRVRDARRRQSTSVLAREDYTSSVTSSV